VADLGHLKIKVRRLTMFVMTLVGPSYHSPAAVAAAAAAALPPLLPLPLPPLLSTAITINFV
jgi:hypothetical protein